MANFIDCEYTAPQYDSKLALVGSAAHEHCQARARRASIDVTCLNHFAAMVEWNS